MRTPLLESFLAEGRDLVEDASECLLLLERTPEDPEVVNRAFRSVHTLKGNSGLFEFAPLTELLHAAEELMVLARDGGVSLTGEIIDVLLETSDAVRVFLDEIDGHLEISTRAAEEGRRLTAALAALVPKDEAPDPVGAEAEAELPGWAEEIPVELAGPGPGGEPVVLFEYRPEPTCFFRGEDPLLLASAVPGVRWRRVDRDPAEETEDVFHCALVLRGLSEAPEEDVRHALRYVEEETRLWAWSPSGPPASGVFEAPEAIDAASARALAAKQAEVLEEGGDRAAPAAAEVLLRALAALGERETRAEVEALGPTPAASDLAGVLRRYLDAPAPDAEPPSAPATPEARETSSAPASKILKVDQEKVDRLMNLIGQLVVAKNGLPYIVKRLESHGDVRAAARELKDHGAALDRVARELQSGIMEVRMLPVSQIFQRFPRLVRDVSRKLDKEIELSMVGEETRADKNVIEVLSEPLVHLVRNALDHGIEPSAERVAKGKPSTGHLRLTATNANESVVIAIEDDGRGIDPEVVRAKAVRKGLLSEAEAEALSDQDARMLIFAPGFSTKEETSELSGRGVGMDVVRATIEKVGGQVSLESEVGEGTRITSSLPLSMVVSRVMTVHVDGQLYGVGMDAVVETVRHPAKAVRRLKDREALVLRERLVPLFRLRRLLGLEDVRAENDYGEEAVLVLRVGGESLGLVVDEFGENMEVLARPLEGLMADLPCYSGSAVLGDGRVLLLLEMKELLKDVLGQR